MCSEIQDCGEVAEPNKVEIVALSEKATSKNKNSTRARARGIIVKYTRALDKNIYTASLLSTQWTWRVYEVLLSLFSILRLN